MGHGGSESMGRRAYLLCTLLGPGAWAHAAPVVHIGPDIFDHLASTYPIEDWVTHARADSNDSLRSYSSLMSSGVVTADNTLTHVSGRRYGRIGTARALPVIGKHPCSVAPDPCLEMQIAAWASLPDDIGGHASVLPELYLIGLVDALP